MRPIHHAHVEQPVLAVADVAAADDPTALAVQELLAARCAIAPADRTTRAPGEPGVGRAASWTCARSPARSTAGVRPRPADQPWSGRGRARTRRSVCGLMGRVERTGL
ncbi:DUF6207 family protein [Streptomyces griseorubiginosus]